VYYIPFVLLHELRNFSRHTVFGSCCERLQVHTVHQVQKLPERGEYKKRIFETGFPDTHVLHMLDGGNTNAARDCSICLVKVFPTCSSNIQVRNFLFLVGQPFFLSPPWHPVPPTPFIYISPYFIRNNKSEALGLSALIINTSIQTDSCRDEGKICLSVVRDYGCVRKNEAHPQSFCLRNQPDSMIDYKLPQIKGYRDTAIPSFFFCLFSRSSLCTSGPTPLDYQSKYVRFLLFARALSLALALSL
jgi:hypothetical protein